jgi:hypothetical protein
LKIDANAELAKLQDERTRASAGVTDLERAWREAVETSRHASAELAEVERHGANATTRRKAEEKLTAAKAKASEPRRPRRPGMLGFAVSPRCARR